MSIAELAAPCDLYITPELHRRAPKTTNYLNEKLALQDIAGQMVDHPGQVLPKLVERAMELTGAASAGISVFEPQDGTPGIFRWRDLRGELARFEGSTTPRNHSPCGVCLDRFEPTLTRLPERYYSWIADVGVRCPEVLLVPLHIADGQPLGTLWIVAEREGDFDSGDARVMRELASFVGIALAMQQDRQRLREALERRENAVKQQELLTAEMNHRVKNLFSIVDAMIHVSKRTAKSADAMAKVLSERLHAMAAAHALVHPNFDFAVKGQLSPSATLSALLGALFKPYDIDIAPRFVAVGPEIGLGRQATTDLALVFHELATNAAKHGALSAESGMVSISWKQEDAKLLLQWQERGGPAIENKPRQSGFGSTLIRNTIGKIGGALSLDWQNSGLVAELSLPIENLAD